MCPAVPADFLEPIVPNVVVVDPRFDAYKPLAASARLGKLNVHFRSSGADAVRLAQRLRVDAWLIAADLDDMSGHDLVPLLQAHEGGVTAAKVALVADAKAGKRQLTLAEQDASEAGADSLLTQPITFRDLEELLGMPTEDRAKVFAPIGSARTFVTLPVGVGAAVIAIAVLMMG